MQTDTIRTSTPLTFLKSGGEMGKRIRAYDWSQTVLGSPEQWPESLRVSTSILLNSQFPMFVWWGPEMITLYNDAYQVILAEKHPNALGSPGPVVWAEIWDVVGPMAEKVMREGTSTWAEDQILYMNRHGYTEETYFTFSYSPVFNEQGEPAGVFCACTETTEKVISARKIKESERNFRNLVSQAPVGICIVSGEAVLVEVVNDLFLKVIGRQRTEFEYARYWDVLQEARDFYEPILKNVFDTGIPYIGSEHRIPLIRNGVEEVVYINFVYEPIKDEQDSISKVMILAIDVTPQVLSRRKIEEAEERARLSIKVSQLASFEVDLLTDAVIASPRLDEIFDIQETTDRGRYVSAIHPEDRPGREAAFNVAYETGLLEYEARVVKKDGMIRCIRTRGKVFFDEAGKPARLIGVSQDITEQKEFEEELNKQVKQRTLELQNKNLELERSNQNLEEFAHAASHDLKEPIRKIVFFSDRLKHQLSDRLTEEEIATLNRIESATRRMGSLIDDLLQYSHVSFSPRKKETINLNDKVAKVLEDLDLDIQQKGAIVEVHPLPVIAGYRRQLQQLFQNLISNALKYSKAGVPPHIIISAETVSAKDSDLFLPDAEHTDNFHVIKVSDNGIGFDQENAERIFQMFQRLHGKHEYSGTGVGLTIARKVAENHNGKITAESQPGEGATFKIYLPAAL